MVTEILIVEANPLILLSKNSILKGVSRNSATSKIELFVTSVNGFQPLTNVTKDSILDVTGVLDPYLNAFI